MAKQFDALNDDHIAFIGRQKIFFVASGTDSSHINLSPKGLGGFRVLSANQVCYLDLTGSGNETAAHLKADGRLTLMFCAFEGPPLILRLYGHGRSAFRDGEDYAQLLHAHYFNEETPGARQIVVQDVELVQTSCGYGVPNFSYQGERPGLVNWAVSKGEAGLRAYRQEKNRVSIDGLETGLPEGG